MSLAGFEINFDLAPMLICSIMSIVLVATGRSLAGTTMSAARRWAIGAAALMLWIEFVVWKYPPTGDRQTTLRFLAAITTFCPMMAVLGAKRPQHGPWQMIVLSLWCILALPAAESYFVRRGAAVQIHDVRGWFLWVLIGLGCLNYVGTRYGVASLIAAMGQVVLLSDHLPLVRRGGDLSHISLGMSLLLIAILIVVIRSPKDAALDVRAQWIRFRDRFGTFWSFRIAERFNSQAIASSWPCRVGHFGFRHENGGPNCDVPLEAAKLMKSLLGRFESDAFGLDHDG